MTTKKLETLKELVNKLDYQEFILEEEKDEIKLCAIALASNLYKYRSLAPLDLLKNLENKEYLKKYSYDDIYLKFPVFKMTVAELEANQEKFENEVLAIVTRYNRFAYDKEIKSKKITMNFFGWLVVEVVEQVSLKELKSFRKNITEEAEMFLKGLILNRKTDYIFLEDEKNIYIKYENQEEEIIYDKEKEQLNNWLDIQVFLEFLRFINNEEKIYKKDFVIKNLKKNLKHRLKALDINLDEKLINDISEKYYNVNFVSIVYREEDFEDYKENYLVRKDLMYKHSWAGKRFYKSDLELIHTDSEKFKFGKEETFIFSDNGEEVTDEEEKEEPVVDENSKLIIVFQKEHYKNDFDTDEIFKSSIGIYKK